MDELGGCLFEFLFDLIVEPIFGRIVEPILGRALDLPQSVGASLTELALESSRMKWVLIALVCWTVFVAAAPWVWVALDAYRYALTSDELEDTLCCASAIFCPGEAVLTFAVWAGVAFAAKYRQTSATSRSPDDSE